MAKMGCAKCGGTKKMAKGGTTKSVSISKPGAGVVKETKGNTNQKMGIYGIAQTGPTGPNNSGIATMKKGGTKKEHPITAFRKANEARNERVMKSLPKAKDGVSTSTLATELYGTKKETIGNNVNTNRVLDNKGRTIGVRPSSKIAARGPNPGRVPKGIDKPVRTNNSKTPAAPKSPEPVRKPSIEFGDPNVGFTYNKPLPKTKYEDAVINTKSPYTRTPAKPVSGYTPKKGATSTPVKKPVGPKPKSAAAEFKAGMAAGPVSYAISNMFKKKGGTVKSKKKK